MLGQAKLNRLNQDMEGMAIKESGLLNLRILPPLLIGSQQLVMRFLVRDPGEGGALVGLQASWQGLVLSLTGRAAQPLVAVFIENSFIYLVYSFISYA